MELVLTVGTPKIVRLLEGPRFSREAVAGLCHNHLLRCVRLIKILKAVVCISRVKD